MIKRYKTIILGVLLYILLFVLKRDAFYLAIENSWGFLFEMIKVLPPVMVITALISVWVPSSLIDKSLGKKSGLKGILISFITGALSSGPIYAAFPAVLVLFKKGASIRNMTIILSSWAVIKIPMLFVESSFLGLKFTILRFLITIPVIVVLALIMEKIVKKSDIVDSVTRVSLPNLNCGACGYSNCSDFSKAVDSGEREIRECRVLKS